jgi:5-methylcytosine-specific restriction endonuclease McrA
MAFNYIPEFRWAGRFKPAIPADTRKSVLKRANGCCEQCGTQASLFSKLELHHLHYETEGRESPDDLRAYCRACHRRAHTDINGDFWVDPEEMACHWATYFNERD